MLKIVAVLCFALLPLSPALADPLDDLFIAAQNGDADKVEALLAGAESAKERRDMMWMLGGSHEALRSFTRIWAEAEPDNAVALTARAWSRYREGFLIRGTNTLQHTWPASLQTSTPIIAEAYALSERALAIDPSYLPASDAVIIIGEVSGHQSASVAEAERILTTAPNRHSLVISASTVRPDWLGNMGVKTDLCDSYAGTVTDAPGYTPEMCVIDAVYAADTCCIEERDWANEHILAYIDEPLMEESVLHAAKRNVLPPEAADRLRARLAAENRLTVDAALSGRLEILEQQYPADQDPLEDPAAFRAAFDRELEAARKAADRDPGDPDTLGRLSFYYSIAPTLDLREVGYYQIPPPDDIVDRYMAVSKKSRAYRDDMAQRVLLLVTSSPRNIDALIMAGLTLRDHGDDPIAAVQWNHALFTNAILYANYKYDVIGEYLAATKYDRMNFEQDMQDGKVPTYDESVLATTFDCPYVRALRLLDAACDEADLGREECYNFAGLSLEDEQTGPDNALARSIGNGTCVAEREGPLDSLTYEEIDLKL